MTVGNMGWEALGSAAGLPTPPEKTKEGEDSERWSSSYALGARNALSSSSGARSMCPGQGCVLSKVSRAPLLGAILFPRHTITLAPVWSSLYSKGCGENEIERGHEISV